MSSASHRPVFPLVLTVMTIALGLLAGPVAARPIVAPAKKAVVTHRARRVNRRHRKAHRAPAHRGAHTATAARRRPSHPHKPPVQHHTTPPPPPVTPPPPPPSAPSSPGTPPQTPGPPPVTTPPPPSGTLAWTGNFETGSISQWLPNSGGAQCANYGVPSANYHDRGTLSLDSGVVGDGRLSGRVDLPATVAPYTTSVCELLHTVPVGLGSDEYYGFMFYVPVGWDTGTSAFWGVQIAQFHFTNVWGSPVAYQLHDDHLTLALETGSCDAVSTANPSCDWRSQADLAGGPNLPGYYVIPPGSMPQGHWYETIMHVHWAADSTGQIQTWFRQKGQSAWSQSVNVSGVPTVQWDRTVGCRATSAVDKVGAYRGPSSVPVSVWFDDVSEGPGFASVAGSMP